MTTKEAKHYQRLRAKYPDVSATCVIQWARNAVKVDAVKAEIEWSYRGDWRDLLDIGQLDGFSIRVYADDEVYDWGCAEPTEEDQRNLEVIGVGVRVNGDDDDLDAIWSVGYLDHDGHREAIETAVYYGLVDRARAEIVERERTRGYVETV